MTTALLKGNYGARTDKNYPALPEGASNLTVVLYGLLLGHIGEGAATPRREFLERARYYCGPATRITDEHLRMAKEELIEAGIPVGSGDGGWWLVGNFAEGERAAEYLEQRGKDLMKKGRLIREATYRIFGDQTELKL